MLIISLIFGVISCIFNSVCWFWKKKKINGVFAIVCGVITIIDVGTIILK